MTAIIQPSRKQHSNPNDWYTDSGASDYYSPFKELFETFNELEEPTEIETAEGIMTRTATGTITVPVIDEDDNSPNWSSMTLFMHQRCRQIYSLLCAPMTWDMRLE